MKPRVAFFDVDGTVLQGVIELAFVWYLVRRGKIGFRAFCWTVAEFMRPKQEGIASLMRANKGYLKGKTMEQIAPSIRMCTEWALRHLYPQARREVERFRAVGARVVLLSASLEFLVSDVGKDLGADIVVGARAEMVGGRFTGRLAPPQPYSTGKVQYAKRVLERLNADPAECVAFGNSRADIPLLAYVGEQFAVNPSRLLFTHATRSRWHIVRW